MSTLTSTSAYKAIAALDGPVDLRKYTKIKPEVAQCLCCEADLDLSGLKEFTPKLAEAFKRHNGKLILDGVINLDKDTAIAIKENFKGSLHFGGVEVLEDEVAQILSERVAGDGNWKYWPKALFPKIKKFNDTPGHLAFFEKLVKEAPRYDMHVEEFSAEQARIVAKKDEEIFYTSIERINAEVAMILSTSTQKICFSNIKNITTEAAEAFSNHREELDLGGLEKVDDPLAMAFSKHIGPIKIGGLKKMPDEPGFIALAKKLASENKASYVGYMEEVGEKVAEILSTCDKISITSLKVLPETEGHKKLWDKMCLGAGPNDYLSFFGLEIIPDAFAATLAKSPAKVSLNSLRLWEDSPGHIEWTTRLCSSPETYYLKGEYFPDRIASIFAKATNVELQDLRILDSSAGNLALASKYRDGSKYINLRKISKEAAKILSEGNNDRWDASNLEEIDAETFANLFGKKSHIYLTKLEKLGKEISSQCVGEKSLGFPSVKVIDIEVAKDLGSGSGSLNLGGLTSVEEDCLVELVKREGELSLGSILEVSEKQAEILSKLNGSLALEGLVEISNRALENLLKLSSIKTLNLKSLPRISEENARQAANREGSINLEGIEELKESEGYILLARKLAKAWRVELPKLQKIGPKIARELSNNSTVKLKNLTALDKDTARELARTSSLYLPSLRGIDGEISQALGEMKGDLSLGDISDVSDESFTNLAANKTRLEFTISALSETKASALAKIPNVYIEGLKEISIDAAKCLKGYKGDLYVKDLCKLTPEAAKELRKLKSHFSTTRAGEMALSTGL